MILVLNRFSGVFLWKKHRRYWSGNYFRIIFILVASYPFIIAGYMLGKAPACFALYSGSPKDFPEEAQGWADCAEFQVLSPIALTSNIVNVFLSLVLGLATVFARKIKGNKWQQKQKYETYLLIQSLITTLILVIYEIVNELSKNVNQYSEDYAQLYWSLFIYNIKIIIFRSYLFSTTICLFVIS
uniref:7TM GPCR serpentine receptor class x (Srx) domain-containing protein n=1 Tax=Panagrolaimus superbus TaxID=310955 RepID=A0A914XYP6_9BILA